VTVVPESRFAESLVNKAMEESTDLLLIPWSETGTLSEKQTVSNENVKNKLTSSSYSAFVREALDSTQCNTAVFINKGFSGTLKQRPALNRTISVGSIRSQRDHITTLLNVDQSHHIFMPFFGESADDRVALRLVLQLAQNPLVTATIVYFESSPTPGDSDAEPDEMAPTKNVRSRGPEILKAFSTVSETSQPTGGSSAAFFSMMQKSLTGEVSSRVHFETAKNRHAGNPVQDALGKAQEEVGQNPKNGGDIIVVGRNSHLFVANTAASDCLGATADTMASSGIRASLLVVQARTRGLEA
jgi:hypothetical protein